MLLPPLQWSLHLPIDPFGRVLAPLNGVLARYCDGWPLHPSFRRATLVCLPITFWCIDRVTYGVELHGAVTFSLSSHGHGLLPRHGVIHVSVLYICALEQSKMITL